MMFRILRKFAGVLLVLLVLLSLPVSSAQSSLDANAQGAVIVISIEGSINPAKDDYLKSAIAQAQQTNAKALVVKLNTPGGLLTSMQSMVEQILDAPIPVIVYVSPAGGGAMSAGVFITLAGHVAAMTPGTSIGAAHPVQGDGNDIGGDMREKIENFAVSLIKAISEQRGRDVSWAEQAVRESVAITDREALEKKVIDVVASDVDKLLAEVEGRTVKVKGVPVTLSGLSSASRQPLAMSFKQRVIDILSDPNVAILLGLGALLGIGIELYHPGAVLPGVVGAICLILSLTAGQVLPINYGGLALFGLGIIFFIVEMTMPTFGVWGVAGIVSLVLGSIYLIDSDMVWGPGTFDVSKPMVGGFAGTVGLLLILLARVVMRTARSRVTTGKEGLVGKTAEVRVAFARGLGPTEQARGKVLVSGEIWQALFNGTERLPEKGDRVRVSSVEDGLTLVVEPL